MLRQYVMTLVHDQFGGQKFDLFSNQRNDHVVRYRVYPCAVDYHHREGDLLDSLLHLALWAIRYATKQEKQRKMGLEKMQPNTNNVTTDHSMK